MYVSGSHCLDQALVLLSVICLLLGVLQSACVSNAPTSQQILHPNTVRLCDGVATMRKTDESAPMGPTFAEWAEANLSEIYNGDARHPCFHAVHPAIKSLASRESKCTPYTHLCQSTLLRYIARC